MTMGEKAGARVVEPANMRVVADGLRFPEGPVALGDGSVLVVEVAAGVVTRIAPDGTTSVLAEAGQGPNGAAVGPDGGLYLCNNGGVFDWHDRYGLTFPGEPPPDTWEGGSLQRVDLGTGEVTTVLTAVGDRPLRSPNDLVFDADGGLWFSDFGARRRDTADRTAVYWCRADGSEAHEAAGPLDSPNGVGFSPDGRTLYVAETYLGTLRSWDVTGPGQVGGTGLNGPQGATIVGQPGGGAMLDSLAVDGEGWVCVGTLGMVPGITSWAPDGSAVEYMPFPDPLTTNICFAPDGTTAYVTLSGTGQLVAVDWPRPGGRLHFNA